MTTTTAAAARPTGGRARRQVVLRADGTRAVQTKPPRADVLWYPRYRWASVLVRRTHDLDLARQLAEIRWAQIDTRPLVATRIGWWRTYVSTQVPASAAVDQLDRVVLFTTDDTAQGAGPGIEFRP